MLRNVVALAVLPQAFVLIRGEDNFFTAEHAETAERAENDNDLFEPLFLVGSMRNQSKV